MNRKKHTHLLKTLAGPLGILLALLAYACASPGTPDGGPYDEDPPVLLKCSPELMATNNKQKKITLTFDEFIKLENANEKVVVSPPQIEAPEIKTSGKKVEVALLDSLHPNTTYTIDFSDAIVDNNEGNPLGNFAFTFSTGERIDTLEVSGTVLDASNLEPIKGILVGLHADLADSAFVTRPFDRVARTDSRGRFTIRGIAPGTYHAYALQDVDQNFIFSQKSEMIAFSDDSICPSFDFRTRKDTLWLGADSIAIDTIKEVQYTHFMPDNIVLRAFTEQAVTQYMTKNERLVPWKFSLFFAAPADTLPTLEGMNFDAHDAFIIEKSAKNDTIDYWIKDSLVYNIDTLRMRVTYLASDTLNRLVTQTDTLELAPKTTREKIAKEKADKLAEWKKELEKKLKRRKKNDSIPIDTVPPVEYLKVTAGAPSPLELYQNISFAFDEPLAAIDTSAFHLHEVVDSVDVEVPFVFRQKEGKLREYELLAEWHPGAEFKLKVDSLAFTGLYGLSSDKIEQNIKVRPLEEYASLFLNLPGADTTAIVQLLDAQDKPVRQAHIADGRAEFYFVNPGKYYVRLFYDRNGNGVWDTGLYEEHRQAEEVFYYPQPLELKAQWDVEQDWNLNAVPVDRQKPLEITKQKPDEKKSVRGRNAERERNKRK